MKYNLYTWFKEGRCLKTWAHHGVASNVWTDDYGCTGATVDDVSRVAICNSQTRLTREGIEVSGTEDIDDVAYEQRWLLVPVQEEK